MRNFFAVVGIVGTVALVIGCGVIALLVGNLLLDVNRAPVILNTAVETLAPISPAMVATPGGLTSFVVIDNGSEPLVTNLVPEVPQTAVTVPAPEAVIDYAEMLAQPTPVSRTLTDEQLLACLSAQQDGRRMAPYCPTNAAELLGPGR